MQPRRMSSLVAALVSLPLATAVAEPESTAPAQDNPVVDPDPSQLERLAPDVAAGVGWAGFTSDEMRSYFSSGPTWQVRVGVGEWNAVRFEVAYVGSSQEAVAMDASPGARLVGHGVAGQFRINVLPDLLVEPFFFAGAGWARYSVTGGSAGAGVVDSDNVIEVPIGLGAAFRQGAFYADLRASFGAVSSAELVPMNDPDSSQPGASMHRIAVRAVVGLAL